MASLRSKLSYEPRVLEFGTSGRRGKVVDLTQLEVYLNALAELEYLQTLSVKEGGIVPGQEFYFARDLRPSSDRFVVEEEGRGEIAQAVVSAIRDAGMRPVNLGMIPTPALTCYALARGKGSIMVTGSHIPFDRNGYKTNSSVGELLKHQEAPILEHVGRVRERLYAEDFEESLFDERGFFKAGSHLLPSENDAARLAFIDRYAKFFKGSLAGKRLLVYQHSAVGRDLLVEMLRGFGAEVLPAGRSDTFVPIDTENIRADQLALIQALVDRAGKVDAVISADGDSDRPLVLGVDPATGKARFFGGDLLGMVVAEYLKADAVVVPISCNDGVDRGPLAGIVEAKTRIGSPFVIAGMQKAVLAGKRRVCGWEPNGGFLLGSDIDGLTALMTRDAFLPILGVLFASVESGLSLIDLFDRLPRRFSKAALLERFPRSVGLRIVEVFSHGDVREFFTPEMGFGNVAGVDLTDGLRITFDNGDVVHVRPSGNADELRIYAVADTQERADAIAAMGVTEPNGILRSLASAVRER